jgi:uncharacterized protein (DUF433 family)
MTLEKNQPIDRGRSSKTLSLEEFCNWLLCKFYLWRTTMQNLLNRITFNQEVLCGKPLIRGLRISVEMILELLARGAAEEEILQDYPLLEPDDLRAALLYAHHLVARENVFDRVAAG